MHLVPIKHGIETPYISLAGRGLALDHFAVIYQCSIGDILILIIMVRESLCVYIVPQPFYAASYLSTL